MGKAVPNGQGGPQKYRKNKFNASGNWEGKKKAKNERGEGKDKEVHGGSFTLEEVKDSDDWKRRILYEEGQCAKRKYALCLGYLGTDFFGSQINPGFRSVEKEVERALLLAGGISEMNFGDLSKISFSRMARTDKGVHAVSQVLSMKLKFPLDKQEAFVDALNSFLPSDVRAHGLRRVTNSFHAKNFCSGRMYEYLLPTLLLASPAEFCEWPGAAEFSEKWGTAPNGTSSSSSNNGSSCVGSGRDFESVIRDALSSEDMAARLDGCRSMAATYSGWRVSKDVLARFRAALVRYVGTKRYHNFTRGIDGSQGAAERFITSFTCSDPHVDADGLEWTCLTVHGQSFVLNQIRKMVGLAVEVGRGRASLEDMDVCFHKDRLADVPRMPGLGLFLSNASFELYNIKVRQQNANMAKSIAKKSEKGDAAEGTESEEKAEFNLDTDATLSERITAYREGSVWPHVAATERASGHFMLYHAFSRPLQFMEKREHTPKS